MRNDDSDFSDDDLEYMNSDQTDTITEHSLDSSGSKKILQSLDNKAFGALCKLRGITGNKTDRLNKLAAMVKGAHITIQWNPTPFKQDKNYRYSI